MAVESKPLFHPEVLRQQVRSFNLPEQTCAWQPKLQHWAGLITSGRADQFKETALKSANSASGSRPPRGKRLTSLDHTIREGNSIITGFVGLADAEGVFEEGGRVETSRADRVLTAASEGAAAGQGKSLNVGRRRVQRQQVPVAVIGHQVIGLDP
jgi:hypothetical protein